MRQVVLLLKEQSHLMNGSKAVSSILALSSMALPLHSSPLMFHWVWSAFMLHLLNIEFRTLATFSQVHLYIKFTKYKSINNFNVVKKVHRCGAWENKFTGKFLLMCTGLKLKHRNSFHTGTLALSFSVYKKFQSIIGTLIKKRFQLVIIYSFI
jgi:hypothetical protein